MLLLPLQFAVRAAQLPRRCPAMIAVAFLSLLFWSGASSALAQTQIEYVGVEVGVVGTGYAVQNWSDPNVPKAFNTGSAEVYGTAGYCQIRPMAWDPGTNSIFSPAPDGNDLGITQEPDPSLYSPPAFLGSLLGGVGNFANFPGYQPYLAPDGTSVVRQGALSVSVSQGPFDSPVGTNASYVGVPMQFTVANAASFRLGVAVDSVGTGLYAPDYVSVFSTATGTVFSAALVRDGTPEMVFFDITAQPDDTFIVGLWQNATTQSVATMSLVTVDSLSSAMPVLSYSAQGGNFLLSWPPETVGWTLESTGDLMFSNSWAAVSGVTNNSVSVPLSILRQFFRLRENP